MNYLEESEMNIDSIKKDHKEFIKNNNGILKTQQRFESKSYNLFTEESNKIALCSNDNKRMQSIDFIKHMHMERANI